MKRPWNIRRTTPHQGDNPLAFLNQTTRFRHKHAPGIRQFDVSTGAFEKPDAQVPLQALHRAAQRRLGNVQDGGGSPEMQFFGERHDQSENTFV
jgi:hypothetical protein